MILTPGEELLSAPARVLVVTFPLQEEYCLVELDHRVALNSPSWTQQFPLVWAEGNPLGLAAHIPPIEVELVGHVKPVHLRQHPMTMKAWKGIKSHVQKLFEAELLKECQSPWNMPFPLVQ